MRLTVLTTLCLTVPCVTTLPACARVKFHDGCGAKTGFVYYDPLPCLLVRRHATTGEVLDASVQVVPNRARPHYVAHQPGFGMATFKVETTNGVLTKFTMKESAKAEEVAKATEGFKRLAEALLQAKAAETDLKKLFPAEADAKAAAQQATLRGHLKAVLEALPLVETAIRDELKAQPALGPRFRNPSDPAKDVRQDVAQFLACNDAGYAPPLCNPGVLLAKLRAFLVLSCRTPGDRPPAMQTWCAALVKATLALSAACTATAKSDTNVPFRYEVYEIHVRDGRVVGLSPLPIEVLDASLSSGATSMVAAPPAPCGGLPPPSVTVVAPPR